jgi:hypothetical protein
MRLLDRLAYDRNKLKAPNVKLMTRKFVVVLGRFAMAATIAGAILTFLSDPTHPHPLVMVFVALFILSILGLVPRLFILTWLRMDATPPISRKTSGQLWEAVVAGALLGGALAALWTALTPIVFMLYGYLTALPNQGAITIQDFLFIMLMSTLLGLALGIIPSLVIGALTAVLLKWLLGKLQDELSFSQAAMLAIALSVGVAALIHVFAWPLIMKANDGYLPSGLLYSLTLGVPSIIFVIASAWIGKAFYTRGKSMPKFQSSDM